MPYIKIDDREKLRHTLDLLISHLDAVDDEEIEGTMNYVITYLINKRMRPYSSGWRYKWINRAIGVLEAVKLEFYRRLVSKYEDKCIEKNGDVCVYEK